MEIMRSGIKVQYSLACVLLTLIISCNTQILKSTENGNSRILPICCNSLTEKTDQRECTASDTNTTSSRLPQTWKVPSKLLLRKSSQTFSLQKLRDLECTGDTTLETFTSEIQSNRGHDDKPDAHFLSDGCVEFRKMYYESKDYCLDGITPTHLRMKICKEDCMVRGTLCLPKCCPPGQIFDNTMGCRPSSEAGKNWKPLIYKSPTSPLTPEQQSKVQPHYMLPSLECSDIYLFNSNKEISNLYSKYLRFRILTDGRITFRDERRKWVYLNKDEFCVDGDAAYDKEMVTLVHACQSKFNYKIMPRGDFKLYPILMLVSSNFILITIIVYSLLWRTQNYHGFNTLSQSISLYLWFICLSIASLLSEHSHLFNTFICKWIGVLSQFFMLTTFTWLTIISADLFNTFRRGLISSINGLKMRNVNRKLTLSPTNPKSKGSKRFLIYSIIGWGVPLVFVIVGLTLDSIYLDDEDNEIPLPEFGQWSCYIASYSQLYYVYAPVAILMFVNIFLFVYTSVTLYQYRKSTSIATRQMKNKQHSFELFAKLFFVMGISWVFEVISFGVSGGDVTWYWFIFDVINICTPVVIFLIFVLKWDILYSLEQKYPVLKPLIIPLVYLLQLLRCKRPDHIVEEFTSLKTNETSLSKSVGSGSEKR